MQRTENKHRKKKKTRQTNHSLFSSSSEAKTSPLTSRSEKMSGSDSDIEVLERTSSKGTLLDSADLGGRDSPLGEYVNDFKDVVITPDEQRSIPTFISHGVRVDKRLYSMKHTLIVSERGNGYELMGTLDKDETDELYKQTRLYKRKKVVLGKGKFGVVRLVRNPLGDYLAVKKIKDIDAFANEYKFQKMLEEKGFTTIVPVHDTITVGSWENVPTIYQIMPIANLGSGEDLIRDLKLFSLKERNILLRYLANFFTRAFAELDESRIYHVDFKPGNFLLNITDSNVGVYLADFGGALQFNEIGRIKNRGGGGADLCYFPPEMGAVNVGLSEREVYQLLDAWRLGLTLLEIVAPHFVFEYKVACVRLKGVTDYDVRMEEFNRINKELKDVLREHHVPVDLRIVIQGLLKPDWEERITVKKAAMKLSKHQVDQAEVFPMFDRLLKHRSKESIPKRKHAKYGIAKKHKHKKKKQTSIISPDYVNLADIIGRSEEKQTVNSDDEKEKERPRQKKAYFHKMKEGIGGMFHRPKHSSRKHKGEERSRLHRRNEGK